MCDKYAKEIGLTPNSSSDYVQKISKAASKDGIQCALQYHNSPNCDSVCDNLKSPNSKCYECLNNVSLCTSTGSGKKEACCPFIVDAINCSNSINSTSQTSVPVDTSLSTGAIIGIVVGGIAFLIIVFLIIRATLKWRLQGEAGRRIQKIYNLSDEELNNIPDKVEYLKNKL